MQITLGLASLSSFPLLASSDPVCLGQRKKQWVRNGASPSTSRESPWLRENESKRSVESHKAPIHRQERKQKKCGDNSQALRTYIFRFFFPEHLIRV